MKLLQYWTREITCLVVNAISNSSLISRSISSLGRATEPDDTESSESQREPPDTHLTATYFMIVGVILAYIKLAWFGRSYERTGAFVVMLGRMANDVINFVILYSTLVIPFAISFMVLFKNRQGEATTEYEDIFNSVMTLFRMTLVDLGLYKSRHWRANK